MASGSRWTNRLSILSALILTTNATSISHACATATMEGARVRIASESALIVWDAAQHIEHFVRQATFETATHDLGFLVPTPTVPTLAAADNGVFATMDRVIQPEVQHRTQNDYYLDSWLFPQPVPARAWSMDMLTKGSLASTAMATAGAMPSVQVIHTQRVAGYEAAVLAADDIPSLQAWLQRNGYAARPALMNWLAPYVAAHWKITAFKFVKSDARDPQVTSSLVRLSFSTERPFYPYREPQESPDADLSYSSRLLRVFFLSDKQMEGKMGERASARYWPGSVHWSDRVGATPLRDIQHSLVLDGQSLSNIAHLTVFEDSSSPRHGTDDVYFAPAANQERIVPAPIVHISHVMVGVPIEPFLFVVAVGVIVWLVMFVFARLRMKRPDASRLKR